DHIRQVLDRLKEASLVCKRKKCHFGLEEVEYLGHKISGKGIEPQSSKTDAIVNFPTPTNISELRTFLGLCGYYRNFIKNFAELSYPLTELLKSIPFRWNANEKKAFCALKTLMASPPVLKSPNMNLPFNLYT